MIKNLAQLKRALVVGAEFKIMSHARPQCVGQQRRVNFADTTGIYTTIPAEPESKESTGNGGLGAYLPWGKASYWEFRDDGVCECYRNADCKSAEDLVISIQLL